MLDRVTMSRQDLDLSTPAGTDKLHQGRTVPRIATGLRVY
jgi:hypothetical protein